MSNQQNAVSVSIDLTKPVTTLIEKVASATGVLYEPTRIRKKAKAEADAKLMMAKADAGAKSVEARTIRRLVAREARKQQNAESIIGKAIPQLDNNATPNNMDDDWVANFFDKSMNISDEEMQAVWARLLVGESREPGAYSKRTVNLLSEMEKKDASLFTGFAQFTVRVDGSPIPYVNNYSDDVYVNASIDFSKLQHLDSLGLIRFDSLASMTLTKKNSKGGSFFVQYGGHNAVLSFPAERATVLDIGHVSYTQQGAELLRVCAPESNAAFWQHIVTAMANGLTLQESTVS